MMQEEKVIKKKRLTIEISEEMHSEVKVLAAFRGISMKIFTLRALIEKIAQEKNHKH